MGSNLLASDTAEAGRVWERGRSGVEERSPERGDAREAAVRQYTLGQILAVWSAAAGPMGVLAWVVAPWLRGRLGGAEPLVRVLLLCLTAGLVWQFVLVLLLTRHELGGLRWPQVRAALWLHAPRDPRTGRTGGRVWWWLLPFVVLFAFEELLPGLPVPAARDFAHFVNSASGKTFFHDAWGWFAVYVALALFNTVLGEELLFRGLLLPRMRGVFGRWDWLANGVLFAAYHVHVPWVIPTALIDSVALAYPSRRFRSAWMGIVVHSTQSVFFIGAVLAVVLA